MKKRTLIFLVIGWLVLGFVGNGIMQHEALHDSAAIYAHLLRPIKQDNPKEVYELLMRNVDFIGFEKLAYGTEIKSYYLRAFAGPITLAVAIADHYTHFIGRMVAKKFLGAYGGWQDVKFSSHWGFTAQWPLSMFTIHAGGKKPVEATIPVLSPKGWM